MADLMHRDSVVNELEPERFLWDRQPGESLKAFDAFVRFRDMGPRRLLRDVALELHCSGANVRRWAARWFWHNRVAAFEEHLDREKQEEMRRGRVEMAERQREEGQMLQSLAMDGVAELKRRRDAGLPLGMKPSEIAILAKYGAEMERTAVGEGVHASPGKVDVVIYPISDDNEPLPPETIHVNN